MANKELTIQCCVCGRIKVADGWKKKQLPRNNQYSHGYCPKCLNRTLTELANWEASKAFANI